MAKELVTRRADKPTHTLAARDFPRTAVVIMVNTPSLVPVTKGADILPPSVPPERLPKRLVLLGGEIVLLGYVRQPTGQ
jgi:hypothetical protein